MPWNITRIYRDADDETRCFGDDDVVLLEDTWGKGHWNTAVNGQPRKSIFVTLD